MAFSWQESTVASGTQNITCDIEYLDKSYIHVYLDGEETTAFSWTSDTVIRLNTALTKDTAVLLIRKTEREYLYIMFASGAPFIEANVDSQNKQFLHLAQELVEGRAIEGFYGDISFNGYRITNLGSPESATDAANKQYVDDTYTSFQAYWEVRFQKFLLSAGYEFIGDYEHGPLTFTGRNQYTRYGGQYYRLNADTDVGFTTTGTTATSFASDVTHFVLMDGDTLRQNLASTEEGMGADLVGWKRSSLSTTISTLSRLADAHPIFCYEHADVITDKPDSSDPTTWDWTPAIDAAIAASKSDRFQPVVLPHHAFITTGGHVITSNTPEFSGGSPGDGRKYKGVPIIGFGPEISKAKFKPASASSICFSLVGNSGGHKTAAYMRDFSIEPYDSSYQLLGYGIQYNCVNYARTDNVAVYMLNENFRLLNGISGGWTEFNSFTDCFSYRGNVCYSFVRTSGNDSFHGTQFTNCFGQIKKVGGGYGIKATGVSSSALVWVYNSKLDIKFYAGAAACKVISLSFAEFTGNHGDLTCEGTTVMEALDDNSRMTHNGSWINNGTTTFSVVTELEGAQGRFVFRNAQSKSTKFSSTDISSYTPYSLYTTPESYSVNGAYPAVFRGQGSNFASPFFACYNYSGNGFFFGRISSGQSLSDFSPSWWLSSDGGIIQSHNSVFRFRVSGGTETYRVSSSSIYPNTDNGMQLGLSTVKWSAAYFKQFAINDTGLVPTSAATYNIASSSTPVNNIYSQNAVTVISDETYKDSIGQISDSDEMELLVEAVGSVPFSFWKLKAAIALKGDGARWHVGVIAQQVRDAIAAKGLDWTKYGLITYDKHSQIVTLGDDGFYYPVLEEGELSSVATNELGYITTIDGADSITEVDGVITYTREIYMLRMEEFLTLRMAYIESKLA